MANSMYEVLAQQVLGGGTLGQLSRQLGTDESTTNQAVAAALPVLISALARNASDPQGADALHGALARDHDGSLLDNLGGHVKAGDRSDGDAILGHVLGQRRAPIEQVVGRQTGLDSNIIGQLLPILAPVVLAYLGRAQRQQDLGPKDLSDLLAGEGEQAVRNAPPQLGGLAGLLDADRDGDVSDDAARLGVGLLGRLLGGRK